MKLFFNIRGSIIIEFALILPVLILISLGSFDVYLYISDRQTAKNIIGSQTANLLAGNSLSEVSENLSVFISSKTFNRVIPSGTITTYSVCLCSGDQLTNILDSGSFVCSDPPRCETYIGEYSIVSVQFLLDSTSFFLPIQTFFSPFTESIVIRGV